jgi:hypothetical protein
MIIVASLGSVKNSDLSTSSDLSTFLLNAIGRLPPRTASQRGKHQSWLTDAKVVRLSRPMTSMYLSRSVNHRCHGGPLYIRTQSRQPTRQIWLSAIHQLLLLLSLYTYTGLGCATSRLLLLRTTISGCTELLLLLLLRGLLLPP